MKRSIIIIAFMLFWAASFAQNTGQTTNQGKLYVSPNTVMTIMSDFDNQDLGEYENNGEVIFHGNFNNDGVTTYNLNRGEGYTRFEGFLQQNITGSMPAEFYNVLFNNPNNTATEAAFRLFGDISVSGNADFFNGVIKDDVFGGIIVFENNATHSNVGNDSHVDGFVVKNGSTEFTYPIGDQDSISKARYYRYAAISASGDQASSFNGKYYLQNSNDIHPHSLKRGVIDIIDTKEYWRIDKAGSQADIMVTLSWDKATTDPAILVQPYEEIHIVRWDEQENVWVDEGGVANEVNATQGTVTGVVNVEGYGIFALARVKSDIMLPGDIVIYNGVTPDGDGQNDYFVIDNLKNFPKNTVEIYNRWGVKVFETAAYDTRGNVFNGTSEGRATVTGSKILPTGTYFYIIKYVYEMPGIPAREIKKAGYLYLSSD
ncbi:gliding motility-associated C-terminal domain-containing protein [Flavobacterium sp. AG291]|uniref:gliding motility-associated C-terminal domain-containing protein n=1 Tax=Flavobacterium sp. AG291 TaxID=2184000 RepID=UPI0013140B6A|nr:gliding motility-associated C-terminal domain-containing protein [Flavobacterium sp. AG291]